MKERPILFSGAMVRAILDGRKTQTRRVLRGSQPSDSVREWLAAGQVLRCPYGAPGDRLWVRETWCDVHPLQVAVGRYSQVGRAGIPGPPPVGYHTIYRADGEYPPIWHAYGYPYRALKPRDAMDMERYPKGVGYGWNSSIHMPRWASRITLEVTGVRIERVQDISLNDMRAEGVRPTQEASLLWRETLADNFRTLWDGINAARGYGWDVNPWVWVVTFRKV